MFFRKFLSFILTLKGIKIGTSYFSYKLENKKEYHKKLTLAARRWPFHWESESWQAGGASNAELNPDKAF